ncbi:MAG TPA: divalent-cation tolerance protein CutA [Candidatus Polarisedimenticolaceae bacterium]|nr:divalent-cation tolerance protein CutA [Candidatus Polarisedimenticolaceae bacterium]
MNERSDDFLLVLTTAGSAEQARAIARGLVERRLVACANVVPGALSIYRWQGRVEEQAESLVVLKTAKRLFPELRRVIRELHSYELPEILALPIADGDPDYLDWLGGALADENTRAGS